MSSCSFTDLTKIEDLPFFNKDKRFIYVQMPFKNIKDQKESLEKNISEASHISIPNITIKTCPIQQVDISLLSPNNDRKAITLINEEEISLMSDRRQHDEAFDLVQVTDVTAVSENFTPSISLIPTSISSSAGLQSLQHTTITVVNDTSPTDVSDCGRTLNKQNEVQGIHVLKSSNAVKFPNMNGADRRAIRKLSKIPNTDNSKNTNITGTIKIAGDSDCNFQQQEALYQWQKELATDGTSCNQKLHISVDEVESNNVDEVCLQVNCKDDILLSYQREGNLNSSTVSHSTTSILNSADFSKKSVMGLPVRKNSSPGGGQVVGDGKLSGGKVFIRTDSVTVRRRVSKDQAVSEDNESQKSLNKINEVVHSVHRCESPNLKDAKFVITCDSFSQVSIANKNPLKSQNPVQWSEVDPDLTAIEKMADKCVTPKRHRSSKENIFSPAKKKKHDDILCCTFCGNYGILIESLWWNKENYFCSEDCLKEFKEEKSFKVIEDSHVRDKSLLTGVEPPEIVPAVPFPWGDELSSFRWELYLKHVKQTSSEMVAASDDIWKIPYPPNVNPFKLGMKMEAIDPCHQSLFCVVTVEDIIGYRLRLHFDGYPSMYDFWCNADSQLLFPINWCKENGRVLRYPPGILNFSWDAYLDHCKQERSTTVSNFEQHITRNDSIFELGMKLEAEDRKNCFICVATVVDILGTRILVSFDGWENFYDSWYDVTSPFIHPIGWAQRNDTDLCAPKDYKDPDSFNWMEYLVKTRSLPAPAKAFVARQSKPFKIGMKVEAIDKRNPTLLRVATIMTVDGYRVKIHFDGWDDIYDYWVDDDSPDIHPQLWGERTGHPLQPPLTQEQCAMDVDSGVGCGTPGCKGFGHSKGIIYDNHHTIHGCPYSLQNLNIDLYNYSIDRLHSVPINKRSTKKAINLEINTPLSADDDNQGKRVRKRRRFFDEINDVAPVKSSKVDENHRKSPVSPAKPVTPVEEKMDNALNSNNVSSTSHQSIFTPMTFPCPNEIQSKVPYLDIGKLNYKSICKLKPVDIKLLVEEIDCCSTWSNKFIEHDIDGIAFILLQQSDLINILKITLGPSKKIMLCIERMKLACNN